MGYNPLVTDVVMSSEESVNSWQPEVPIRGKSRISKQKLTKYLDLNTRYIDNT